MDKQSASTFKINYVATFIEREHPLELSKLLTEIFNLDWELRVRNPCILETTTEALKVYDPETNVVFEEATWGDILEPSVLFPLEWDPEQSYILCLRIRIPNLDLAGYTHQLPVFSVESERIGKSIQNRVAFHKASHSAAPEGVMKHRRGMRSAYSSNHRSLDKMPLIDSYTKNGYRESLYLLNRCLNDIESFGGKLSKYLKKQSDSSKPLTDGLETILPPQRDEFIECIRKIKYAFNQNQHLESVILSSADKIYVRLIKLVQWLDEVCQNRLVTDYPQNLVRHVVEPPLKESSIEAVIERLTPETGAFWANLGDAWNRPSTNWQSPLSTYVPHFKTMPKKQQFSVSPKRLQNFSPTNANSEQVSQRTLADSCKQIVRKATSPRIRNSDHERYYIKIQDRGGRLCFATVEHMKAVTNELSAKQGELFEIMDDTGKEWWKVENYRGEIGLVPRWKMRAVLLNPGSQAYSFSPESSPVLHSGTWVASEQSITFHTQQRGVDSSAKGRVTGPSFNSPVASGLQYDDTTLTNLTPLVLYIPKEMDKLVTERTEASPMLLMPYGQEQESKSRMKPSSHSPTAMTPPIAFDKSSKLPAFGQPSRQNWLKYSHPHSSVSCKPTIQL